MSINLTKSRSFAVAPTVGFVAMLIFLAVYALAWHARADVRDMSGREVRVVARTTQTTPPTSNPDPLLEVPNQSSGGISSSIEGTADSGGNSGGTVTTGDEHVEVFLVNIGPTNTTTLEQGDTNQPPAPAAPCVNDRRSPDSCPQSLPARTR